MTQVIRIHTVACVGLAGRATYVSLLRSVALIVVGCMVTTGGGKRDEAGTTPAAAETAAAAGCETKVSRLERNKSSYCNISSRSDKHLFLEVTSDHLKSCCVGKTIISPNCSSLDVDDFAFFSS